MPEPLILPADGPPFTSRTARDTIGEALTVGATVVAVPVERFEPAFFDLTSGVAGDIVQAFVNYRLRLVVIGELPPVAEASRAFGAFVREGNRGEQPWFVASEDELRERIQARG